MLPEVVDIFLVGEILDPSIIPVVLIEVVYFIFYLVVTMVARSEPHIRQPHAAVPGRDELTTRDARITIGVEEIEDLARDGEARGVVDMHVGIVFEPVETLDVPRGPVRSTREVVEGEEGGGIKALYFVLLFGWLARFGGCGTQRTGHVEGRPVGSVRKRSLAVVGAGVGEERQREEARPDC
jgi:hypothetical protein